MRMMFALTLGAALMTGSIGAADNSPLHGEKAINDKLLIVAVVDKINRGCGTLGVKFFKAQGYVNKLKAEAKALGYSKSEVNAYINDKENKAEMRERRNAYFKSKGASNLDPQSLCVLGAAEMQQQTEIGELLKAK